MQISTSSALHPVTLGMSLPRHERGTPVAASSEDAERIVPELAERSKSYGTSVRWNGTRGLVEV